jgi:predicted heme/steroid binding protein
MDPVSEADLREHNGERGARLWIAHAGVVYDVTDCPKWRTGLHEEMHFPGQDLTEELPEAPHGREVLDRPCVKIIGLLVQHGATDSESHGA